MSGRKGRKQVQQVENDDPRSEITEQSPPIIPN